MKKNFSKSFIIFLVGASLPIAIGIFKILHTHGVIALNHNTSILLLLFVLYFLITLCKFVIGEDNSERPQELETSETLENFLNSSPKREGWPFYLRILKRLNIWFIGMLTGSAVIWMIDYLSK